MPCAGPFWDPDAHADRRPLLLARGRIAAAVRDYFAARDFVEVETGGRLVLRGRIASPFAEPERVTVAQAFERFAGVDLMATVSAQTPDRDALAAAARAAQVRVADDDSWADVFSRVLVEKIEPNLGIGR